MFYLKDKSKSTTIILIIVRYRGKIYKHSTKEKVDPGFWNPLKHRCKDKYADAEDINLRLGIWENHVKSVLKDFSNELSVPDQEEFKKALKAKIKPEPKQKEAYLTDFAKKYKEDCTKSKGTKKAYQTAIKWIEDYEREYGRLSFDSINTEFYRTFKKFVFIKGANSPNFFGTLIKQIKVFMNEAKEHGLHKNEAYKSSYFSKPEYEVDNVYLTVDELLKIYNLKITDWLIREHIPNIDLPNLIKQKRSLEIARDWFLIGAFTALRVSDFSRIEEVNIKDNFIRIRTEKTGAPVVIPVHWIIREILDRGFDLKKKVSDQKLNKQIKTLCKYAGITDKVQLTRFEKGQKIEVVKPKYEWVTTHTARRSGATNMFKAGIPALSIMKITGHKTEKTFLKYIKVTNEENALMLAGHVFFKRTT